MSTPNAEEKCTQCGELNPTTLRMCRMCSSLLPWVEAQRAEGLAQAQSRARAMQQKKAQRRQALNPSHQAKKVGGKALPIAARLIDKLPQYKSADEPMISVGNVEAPTAQVAAIASVLLLIAATFAPLITLFIISVSLISSHPWLGWANLLAAIIAGSVLWNKQYRLCYLSASIGAITLLGVVYPLAIMDRSLVDSPLRLLSWGIVPLVLAPIACLAAAYFGGTPEKPEAEETISANPFSHEKDVLFQTHIVARIKEASNTSSFQRALRSNPQRLKDQLQLTKAATCWREVPDDIKHLLEDAEIEVRHQIGGDDNDIVEVEEPSGTSRAVINGVAVGVLVLFGILFFMFRATAKPIERDIGMLDLTEDRVRPTTSMIVQSIPHIIELVEENPNAPKITVLSHEDRIIKRTVFSLTYALGYSPKSGRLDLTQKTRANGKTTNSANTYIKTVPVEDLPDFLASFESVAQQEILADEFKKSEEKFRQSQRDLERNFNELGRSFR